VSKYEQYIRHYSELFPKENLLVLPFEDLKENTHGFFRRCFEFFWRRSELHLPGDDSGLQPAAIWDNPPYRWFFNHPH
jgi:hypothetical protein